MFQSLMGGVCVCLINQQSFLLPLLGFDFLSKYGAVIDFEERMCRIMGKAFPLVVPEDSDMP